MSPTVHRRVAAGEHGARPGGRLSLVVVRARTDRYIRIYRHPLWSVVDE